MQDIRDRLAAKNVRIEDFQAINALLISRGFLSREDGPRHRNLYSVAQRAERELEDVLTVVYGASLLHDSNTGHYRLMPFGDREAGLPDPGEDMEIRKELRGSNFKDFVAALLTLKILFDEMLGERKMGAGGRVTVRVTEFVAAMNVHFKVDLPATEFHRKAIFLKLKKHGVAEFDIDNLKDEDAVINIRPEIATLVTDSAIAAALATMKERSNDPEVVDGPSTPLGSDDFELSDRDAEEVK
jgi:hypothetical protein